MHYYIFPKHINIALYITTAYILLRLSTTHDPSLTTMLQFTHSISQVMCNCVLPHAVCDVLSHDKRGNKVLR